MPIYLAHDGSINGDWVARYAVRMAAHAEDRALTVLHVEDAAVSGAPLAERLANIEMVAQAARVRVNVEICPLHDGVSGGLVERIPEGEDTIVICGARVKGGRRGFLSGTISEQLLRYQKFETVALRVVQPGNLGVAPRMLLPVAGDRRGVRAGAALVKLLGPDVQTCRLLHVVEVGERRLRRLDATAAGALRHSAETRLKELERGLSAEIGNSHLRLDSAVRVSDDWAQEILIDAGAFRANLITLEAPVSSLENGFNFGDPVERVLRDTPCDVAVYRGVQ